MYDKIRKSSVAIILSALIITAFAASYRQNASGQTTQGETAAANANMTRADFNSVTENLITARQAILNNDSVSAFNAINTAGSDLFELSQNAAVGNETITKKLVSELRPVQNGLGNTRDALRDNNSTQALRSLNSVEVRLLETFQGLS
jgi:hypothetical protein